MFLVTLRFAEKAKAPPLMDAHNAWLQRGFDDGVFLLAGSLQPSAGGAILAHAITYAELEQRLEADPFVAHEVVQPEIIEIAPVRTDDRLAFLKG